MWRVFIWTCQSYLLYPFLVFSCSLVQSRKVIYILTVLIISASSTFVYLSGLVYIGVEFDTIFLFFMINLLWFANILEVIWILSEVFLDLYNSYNYFSNVVPFVINNFLLSNLFKLLISMFCFLLTFIIVEEFWQFSTFYFTTSIDLFCSEYFGLIVI